MLIHRLASPLQLIPYIPPLHPPPFPPSPLPGIQTSPPIMCTETYQRFQHCGRVRFISLQPCSLNTSTSTTPFIPNPPTTSTPESFQPSPNLRPPHPNPLPLCPNFSFTFLAKTDFCDACTECKDEKIRRQKEHRAEARREVKEAWREARMLAREKGWRLGDWGVWRETGRRVGVWLRGC
jgi:hypothetical protein